MTRVARACLGVDIGTTSLAAVITDGRGKILASRTMANPSAGEPTAEAVHEQNPEAILAAVNALIARCEFFCGERGMELGKIGWTGQMHGLVAVDRKLRALTPFVTWRDRRCAPPALGSGILSDWRTRKVKNVYRALTIPGYVIARRTGRCLVDETFRASMGTDAQLAPFARWLPDEDDSQMLGDNQAGVYAAQKIAPGAAVVNIGTSGQLSVIRPRRFATPQVDIRPYPGGRTLLCRASHVGGAALARLRKSLGCSWKYLNDEAERNPRIAECVASIVDDLADGVPMDGVRTVVSVGNALRLNPCLRRAVERRLRVKCIVPEIEEMAAWGAALYALARSERVTLRDPTDELSVAAGSRNMI